MSKWELIDSVIDNVKFICQKRDIDLSDDEIRQRAIEWCNHTGYFTIDDISALVLHSKYDSQISVADMPAIRIKYYNEYTVV